MSKPILSLGFSPCPNDTFIFDAMVHSKDLKLSYDYVLEDVETLNAYALKQKLDISKMSFATYFQVSDQYQLLSAGSALGFGVGPVLVSRIAISDTDRNDLADFLSDKKIGVPGKFTSAHLLLQLIFPKAKNKVFMPFDKILGELEKGTIDVGLLIHEGRFTFTDAGFSLVQDLGEAYQVGAQLPVPLGCIAIKKELAVDYADMVTKQIQLSLHSSWSNYPVLSAFIKDHAQELDEHTMRQHIELYVNKDTFELSPNALIAIDKFELAAKSI